ncbi:MAG: hypothetical protein ACTSQV_06165, partial [Alphaproteobacteria bacterium]
RARGGGNIPFPDVRHRLVTILGLGQSSVPGHPSNLHQTKNLSASKRGERQCFADSKADCKQKYQLFGTTGIEEVYDVVSVG